MRTLLVFAIGLSVATVGCKRGAPQAPDLAMPDLGESDLALRDLALADLALADLAQRDLVLLDLGGADLASHDLANPSDAATNATVTLGAATIAQRIYSTSPATGTLTTSGVTTVAGSLLLASAARGTWSIAPDAPTDSHSDTYTLVGTTHAYNDWPNSKTGLFSATNASGGAGQTFSLTWGDIGGTGDEITLSVVEVRGATKIDDVAWVERAAANSLTSASVTTTGPALLVAWWWGSGGVRPKDSFHVAAPGDGFAIIPAATGLKSLSANGYVQVAAAARTVDAAGTYTVTWTTDNEGAQLYLVALR